MLRAGWEYFPQDRKSTPGKAASACKVLSFLLYSMSLFTVPTFTVAYMNQVHAWAKVHGSGEIRGRGGGWECLDKEAAAHIRRAATGFICISWAEHTYVEPEWDHADITSGDRGVCPSGRRALLAHRRCDCPSRPDHGTRTLFLFIPVLFLWLTFIPMV